MAENNTLLDLDAMMEESLDNVPDAPDFTNPPAGEYSLQVKEVKTEKYKAKAKDGIPEHEAQRIRITYSILQTKSVAAGDAPVPDGSMFSETFMGTEQGLGYLKSRAKGILNATDLAGVSLKVLLDTMKGSTFDARITIRKTPNPAGGEYENVQIRVIPPSA
jgi:hypothetical protein